MHTLYEIAQHVITDKPYETKAFQAIETGSQGAVAYRLLTEATNSDVIEKVRGFVRGEFSEESIGIQINNESAYLYLAAAKIIDLDTPRSEMIQSTYKIREMSLFRSLPEEGKRSVINMLNAFSTPPLDKKDSDILLVNEIDLDHPTIKNAKPGEEKNNHLKRVYTYSRKEAQIIPEMVSVIESVMRDRLQMMIKLANLLPPQTTVVYKGCSGAGKSFALKQLAEKSFQGISVEYAVQSSDNIKNDIRFRTKNIFNSQQLHLLGFATFKELSEAMVANYPTLSTLQEGWFNNSFGIESLFKDLISNGLKLEMHDFDGDYTALCLRVLARHQDLNIAKPSLYWIERSFKTSRESREQLLKSLRETDSYEFRFVHADGVVSEKIDPRSIVSRPEDVDLEIETTKNTIITEKDAHLFGEYLNTFIGMTIEAAFEKVKVI